MIWKYKKSRSLASNKHSFKYAGSAKAFPRSHRPRWISTRRTHRRRWPSKETHLDYLGGSGARLKVAGVFHTDPVYVAINRVDLPHRMPAPLGDKVSRSPSHSKSVLHQWGGNQRRIQRPRNWLKHRTGCGTQRLAPITQS